MKAAEALKAGGLVAFPTETVYGLGGDAFNVKALAAIFAAKERPEFDPLIVHICDTRDLRSVADLGALDAAAREKVEKLAASLWPGPLTMVLPKRPEVPGLATSGLPTVAVRLPRHPVAQKLIRLSTGAVAAPSANKFGRLSPTSAAHVDDQLKDAAGFIIDGGRADVGVESTVLDLSSGEPRILRPGGCPREAIEAVIGKINRDQNEKGGEAANASVATPSVATPSLGTANTSPGMLTSHYAPGTPLVLYESGTLNGVPGTQVPGTQVPGMAEEGRLYFAPPQGGPQSGAYAGVSSRNIRVLSPSGDTVEAAANLFEMLHELDALGLRVIRAERAPDTGLGPAINDRLTRAAIK
jgi:L-threonylcarbamoyladenylate synthase